MSPATAPEDAELLRYGWLGNSLGLDALRRRAGFSRPQAAAACLVAPETFRRWGRDRPANPTAVRLLAVLAGYVPWPGWDGWEAHRGLLFAPGWRGHGLAPGDLFAATLERQAAAELCRRLRAIEQAAPRTARHT